jgi:hypothetical protein
LEGRVGYLHWRKGSIEIVGLDRVKGRKTIKERV